jgi:hypothetical protein
MPEICFEELNVFKMILHPLLEKDFMSLSSICCTVEAIHL